MKRRIEDALAEAAKRIASDDFVRAILTGARKSKRPTYQRIDLRPVKIKERLVIQAVAHDGKKDYTSNHELGSTEILEMLDSGFANLIIDSTSESFQIQITKKEEAISGISRTSLERTLEHDRKKERLLPESHLIFQVLGFADSTGRIKPTARDKYIQIDQLLRILEPTLSGRKEGSEIRVVDLASGRAALTLAVHVYLSERFLVETIGIERNPDLVKKSTDLVAEAHLQKIDFMESEIASAPVKEADLVLALHACDTATDDAIEFVTKTHAGIALIVPCCHQTRTPAATTIAQSLPFFGKDGIVDERLLDLASDAMRAEKLRESNYQVDIVEFVGDEHTARNLLFRVRSEK